MLIEIKKTTVNCGSLEVKSLKELDSLYSEGVVDEVVSDFIPEIKYVYYLDGKKIKTDEV